MRKVTPYVSVLVYMALLCIFVFNAGGNMTWNWSSQETQDETLPTEISKVS